MESQIHHALQVETGESTERDIEHENHQVSIDATPKVHRYRGESQPRSQCVHDVDETDGMVYASFNLQNINAPAPPKWKHNDHILEGYKKFHHSCQHIFDRPMAHVMNGRVKTNMFLIWCGPNREDIHDNFHLDDAKKYNIDYVMDQFEQYCEPTYNFRAARYKFQQVSQRENEMTNAFYHCIQKLCIQCQFSDDEE